LAARDVAVSVAFYRRLGFSASFVDLADTPRYAVIIRDACELHVQWADSTQWDGPKDRPVVRLLVDDVDALFAEFVSAEVAPDASQPPSPWARPGDTPWGTREFHVRDPAANVLQFYCMSTT
jgi:hypothetical protein